MKLLLDFFYWLFFGSIHDEEVFIIILAYVPFIFTILYYVMSFSERDPFAWIYMIICWVFAFFLFLVRIYHDKNMRW